MISVESFGKAWQRGRRALWGQRLVGGGGRVAGQRRGWDVAGGLPTAHLGEALSAELGAKTVQRVGPNVCSRRTGRTGARRRTLGRVV